MNESLHALSGAYSVDALDDDERATFEKHLPGCLDCQREVASLREAAALMADEAALAPPPALRESVLAGIQRIRPLPPLTGTHHGPEREESSPALGEVIAMRPRRRRFAALAAAAAAVVAIGVGSVYQPWQDPNPSGPTLSPADQVLAASDAKHVSIDFKDGSSATLVRSASEGRAVLLTRGMAAPPSGKAFELWLRGRSGVMKPAGMMYNAGDHKVLLQGDASQATAVGITVEPKAGSKSPSSAPIAMFELGKVNT
ncbi:MAG: anti-sigma factor [Marmoricola sp.]